MPSHIQPVCLCLHQLVRMFSFLSPVHAHLIAIIVFCFVFFDEIHFPKKYRNKQARAEGSLTSREIKNLIYVHGLPDRCWPNCGMNEAMAMSGHSYLNTADEMEKICNFVWNVEAEQSGLCRFRELKDNLGNDEPEGDLPILLQTLLSRNPKIFRDKSKWSRSS